MELSRNLVSFTTIHFLTIPKEIRSDFNNEKIFGCFIKFNNDAVTIADDNDGIRLHHQSRFEYRKTGCR